MQTTERQEFAKLLAATMAVFTDNKPTAQTVEIWWAALKPYPMQAVNAALQKHIRSSRFSPKPAEIIDAIQASDGHPGAEEAWAQVSGAVADEGATVVMTEPMRKAFFIAYNIGDDKIAARMAFKEAYLKAVEDAREHGEPPVWTASLGHDMAGREPILLQAVSLGRLTHAEAMKVLPPAPPQATQAMIGERTPMPEAIRKLIKDKAA